MNLLTKIYPRYLIVLILILFADVLFQFKFLQGSRYISSLSTQNESAKPRIALISGGSQQWLFQISTQSKYDDRISLFWSHIQHTISKQCYCKKHNYDFIFETEDFWGPHEDSRLHYFSKVKQVERALPHYDWVFYSDVDVLILNFEKKIETFIEGFQTQNVDIHIFLPSELPIPLQKLTFSNYAFLIKNSAEGRRFIQIWKSFIGKCFAKFIDQPTMWFALEEMAAEFYQVNNRSKCSGMCSQNFEGQGVGKCFQKSMYDEFGFRRGHIHGSPIKAPIAWSTVDYNGELNFESGLCLQYKFGTSIVPNDMIRNAFSIHLQGSQFSLLHHKIDFSTYHRELTRCMRGPYIVNVSQVDQLVSNTDFFQKTKYSMRIAESLESLIISRELSRIDVASMSVCVLCLDHPNLSFLSMVFLRRLEFLLPHLSFDEGFTSKVFSMTNNVASCSTIESQRNFKRVKKLYIGFEYRLWREYEHLHANDALEIDIIFDPVVHWLMQFHFFISSANNSQFMFSEQVFLDFVSNQTFDANIYSSRALYKKYGRSIDVSIARIDLIYALGIYEYWEKSMRMFDWLFDLHILTNPSVNQLKQIILSPPDVPYEWKEFADQLRSNPSALEALIPEEFMFYRAAMTEFDRRYEYYLAYNRAVRAHR